MTTQHAKYIANSEVTYLHKDVQSGKYVVATNIRDLTQAFISRDVVTTLRRHIKDPLAYEKCRERLFQIADNCKHEVIAETINANEITYSCVVCLMNIKI